MINTLTLTALIITLAITFHPNAWNQLLFKIKVCFQFFQLAVPLKCSLNFGFFWKKFVFWTKWRREEVQHSGWSLPVPVGQCHHDVKRRQEQHEMEEGVGVGDAVPLVVQHSVGSAALVCVRLRSVLNQRRLVAAQGQFVHLGVCGVTDANRQRGGGKGAGQRQSRVSRP